MDIAIATLKKHESTVLDAVSSPYSNGSLEGINHLIKL
ncbi:transposase [Lacticaseibacillus chiayiensis]|uniref:Transposase n=1 Tax=Lacticaseibacillus chiayiensis TaxID=2100821 RepID=A0ABY6HAI8_9LACO|nr:transposase [Lacticaseibacillus chiayiensis]UYN57845.1 transposase [Lacticaseibacillus chiayiensis]